MCHVLQGVELGGFCGQKLQFVHSKVDLLDVVHEQEEFSWEARHLVPGHDDAIDLKREKKREKDRGP